MIRASATKRNSASDQHGASHRIDFRHLIPERVGVRYLSVANGSSQRMSGLSGGHSSRYRVVANAMGWSYANRDDNISS